MADIEALMYSYPSQGDPNFSAILATREEFWPTAYDVQRAASQEVGGGTEAPRVVSSRRSRKNEIEELSRPITHGDEVDAEEDTKPPPVNTVGLDLTDENVARHAVRVFCERFMLTNDRMFLYHSTGSGKTVTAAAMAEPLVRNMANELVTSYLEPKRTNIRRVIVIVASDAQKWDFMKKIVETSRRPEYQRAVRLGESQPILERKATYATVLSPIYVFHTKTSFLTTIYGTASLQADIDPTKPDPGALAFANNSVIIVDEIHGVSREETLTARRDRPEEEHEEEDARHSSHSDDFRYAQYHYVFHAIQGSKIIGLSATPMKDSPREIIKIMNLLLPLDRQIPSSLNVMSRQELMPYLRGYISYFKTRSTRVVERGVMFTLDDSKRGTTAESLPPGMADEREDEIDQNETPGFEVIFPVAMSPLQAKNYAKVISEKDSFNRNALRASNIVYPDGTSGHAGFTARFARSTRGWDGMEPNDDYRTYLKTSRENRELLSPKFCTIADIARISRGVVFVYMRNLEGGLYDLAAFLDAEGFERFTPQTTNALFITKEDGSHEMLISKRPRYCLVIGETKTVPGRLDSILNLVNVDENADGEYVKIVLGSAAVRESFDVRNSITRIIASPEQTETAMIQATGRVIRPGAQRALFRKYPDLPAIVSGYRLASYVPDTEYQGKDVDTYLDSARKDRQIKVVERMLRDSSVDCRMMHDINYNEGDDLVDDSPACLYGQCDYVCDVKAEEGESLDSTSMNALYRMEKLLRLKVEISKAAKRNVYIPIEEIDAIVESHALAQRVLETISVTKEQIRDRFGRQAYLYHDRNGVWFASSPIITGQAGDGSGLMCPVSMSDYEHYITTTLITSLDTLTDSTVLLPGILETILTTTPLRAITESIESDHELLKKFSLYLRREVVSKSALLEHVRVRGEERAHGIQGSNVYWVDYSGLLYTRGDLRVYEGDEGITYLVDKHSSGNPLSFVARPIRKIETPGSWGAPGPVLMRILHHRWRTYMRDLFAPYEARYEFYGVVRPSEPNVLRIARRGRDNAKTKTPGRALPSWSMDDLREVVSVLLARGGKPLSLTEAREILDSKGPKEINDFLTAEFEKRRMLLKL